uniref:Voltage-dependent calcium channel L type alpha-1D n=1 Tax=Tetraselmis sp. GSL018 TaxID=582737 RepID=A0A061RPV3_9CHLO
MSLDMLQTLTTMNLVLTQIFTLEVILKMASLGVVKYFKDNFNTFDLVVVILSQVEIIIASTQDNNLSALQSLKTLRVLKAFRVFRIFKMFRYLESLRKIGEVLFKSMSSFVSIGLLTLLFNIVFAIMGLHVFGQYEPDIVYPNFRTFVDSCVLVFQVLTLEDWEVLAYSYARDAGYGAVAFFVAWVIVGNYVFLTLFLAVTLEAFESKYDTETAAQVASVVQEKLGLQQASEEGRNAAGGRGSTMSQEGAKVLVIASAKDSAADDGQQASPSTGREMAAGSEPSGKGSSPQADQSMLSPRDWTSNSSPRNASTPTAYGKLDLGRATKDRESIPVVPMHGEGSMSLEKPAENSIEYFLNAPEPSPESGPRADLGSREFHRPNADLQRLVSSRATAVSDIDEAQDAVQRLGSRSSLVRDEDTIETAPLMPADPLRPSAPATGRRPPRAAGPVAESDDNAAMGAPGPSPNERHGGSSSGAAIQVQGSFNPRLRMSSMARGGTGSGGHAASRSGRDLQQQKNAPLPGAERSDPQGDQGASGSAESGKVSVTGSFNPRLRMGSKQLRDGASAPATAAPLGAELPRTPGTPLGQAQAPPSLLATQQGASSSSTSTQLKRIGSRSTNESTSTGLGSFNPRLRMGGKEARGPIPTAGSRRGSLTSLPEEHDVLNSELPEEMNQAAQPFAADDSSHDSNSRRLKRNASRATNDSGTGSLSSFNPRRRFGQAEQPGGLPEVASQSSQSLRPAPSLQRTASRVTQESVASSAGSCNPRLRYGSGAAASGDGFHSRMSDAAEMEGRAAEHPQRPLMSGYSGDRSDFPGQAHDARPAANKFMGRLSSINLRRMSSIIMGQPHIPPVSAAGPAPAPAGSELGPPPINSKGRRGTMGALIQRIKGWSVGEESDSEETDDDDSNDGDGSSASDRQQAAGQGRLSKRRTTSVSSKVSQSRIEQEILQARELMGEEIPDEAASQMGIRKQRKEDYPPLVGKSLGLLDADNPFRSALYSICTNKYFDYTMFFFIIASCAAMVYEHPFIEDNSTEYWALHYVEIALTSIFGLEAVAKIVAFGMLPYARSVTNLLDLLIVVTSVLLLALETVASNLQAIKGLRVLRAAKPLRTLTRSKGMMLVFKSLSMSLMSMANVSVICLLFFIIFAILGVQLFSGEFYYCSQPRDIDGVVIRHKDNCTGLGEDGNPLEWSNNFLNFDNLGNALMTLFITSTLDGYVETMTLAMSTRGKDHQPMLGANAGSFLFFCIFIMVCAFCLLNLYVGVVFFQFTRIRMLSEAGSAFLTSSQREWLEMSRMVLKTSPLDKVAAPKGRFRRWCYDICMTAAFEYFMIAVIVINVAFMASEQYNMSDAHEDVSDISNLVFTSMFILEAAFKLTGTGWASYWRNSWNRFDLFVVATSVLDLIVTYFGNSFGSFLQVLRVQKLFRLMRVSRVLKLMKNLKGVRSLFSTLVSSLPAFWSVGSLLVLLFFIYAYVGVLLFGTVRINEGMNHHANFTKFWKALNVLLRVATNDDWYPIMKDCMASPPDCDPELGDCGSPVAQWYFSSFVCFVSIIVLNLFTSVVIENFEKQMDQDSWKIMPTMLEEFRELWSHYDDGTSTITPRDLHHLLTRLSPPLGLSRSTTNAELLRFVASLDIPLENGRVPFHRTLFELVRRVSETEIPEGQMKDGIENMVKNAFGNQMHDDMMTFNMAMIVMRLQRKWRANVRSNKIKASRARRRARMDGLVSFEELLKRKDEYADEIMDARMDGQPWVFDDSAGMGSIASWALISAGKAAPQVGKSLRNTTRRGTYFFNGLGQRMQAAFGSNASPSTRTTMNSSKQSPASGGLAGRLRRRLGTVALQAGGSQGISSTRSTRTTKLSGGQSKRGLWRGRNSVVPAQAANLAELAQQNIAARERSLTSASENAKKIQAGSGQDARARYNMGHINVGTAISDWQQYANAAMLQEMMEDGISDSDSEPAGSDGEATAYSSDAPAYSTDHEIEGHSRSSMPELAAPAEAPIEEKAFEPAQKEKAGKNSGKDLVNETALQSLLDDISDSGSSAGGRGG